MRATREKSHSQLGGPTSGWRWKNLRVWGSTSAHPTWQNPPGRRTFKSASPECREEVSLNMCLLDSSTNATKASPLLSYKEGKICMCKTWGSLGTWCFLEFPFSQFSISPLL
uniref:Uncharacterized protein n=1 Tax=Pan paniscus TaxID=9597 RepID=A0A2R9A7Q6_PANPA